MCRRHIPSQASLFNKNAGSSLPLYSKILEDAWRWRFHFIWFGWTKVREKLASQQREPGMMCLQICFQCNGQALVDFHRRLKYSRLKLKQAGVTQW